MLDPAEAMKMFFKQVRKWRWPLRHASKIRVGHRHQHLCQRARNIQERTAWAYIETKDYEVMADSVNEIHRPRTSKRPTVADN